MIRKHIFKDKAENSSVRWRLHEPTRLEAFSDAVFAFALTLVVISLEVPHQFEELLMLMKGFFGFAFCFLFLMLIWHDQYTYFRRFGLQDTRTTFYNMVLLFMVIYLVYPLKFLFFYLSSGFSGQNMNSETVLRFQNQGEVCQLMIIYGIGYLTIYILMTLMYAHALKRKNDISLSPLEVYNTRTYMYTFMGRIGVVLLSIAIAIYGLNKEGLYAFLSGISYSGIGLVMWGVNAKRSKKIKTLFSQTEIDEVMNEVVIVREEKN
ncbi:MAG: TMEM175 family protein [Bacteroidota bacterium]